MKNGVDESDTNSNNIMVIPNAPSNYSYLPRFIKDKIIKDTQANLYSSCTNKISNNNCVENESEKNEKSTNSNSKINDKNLYREFFKSNVFSYYRENVILPVINVDNIDSYMKKITKENNVKNSKNLEKNDFKSQKYSHSLNVNNINNKLKLMKPKTGENLEKFEEAIQAKQKIKFEKFDPKEILHLNEKRIINKRFKIPKRLGEKNSWKNQNNKEKIVLENLKSKNQTQKMLDDSALIYNDMLEFRDFIETFDNKFKKSLMPSKNFSKNIFKFEDDFYENLCHKIQNVSKPAEITDIHEDFSSIRESQNSESFFSKAADKSYIYTDGSNISEINLPEGRFFKLKNSNFKIKRNFTVTNKIKERKVQEVFRSTIKITRKNMKSISTTLGTLKGVINKNGSDFEKVNSEIDDSFINSSFLVENIPDELLLHLENLQKKNLPKDSNTLESYIIENTMQKNLYKKLEKKLKKAKK